MKSLLDTTTLSKEEVQKEVLKILMDHNITPDIEEDIR